MPAASRAQGDVEYLMEVGGGLGLVSYEGDYNSNPLKGQQPMASVLLRRMLNPYHGFRFSLSYGKLKGSSTNEKSYYPDSTDYSFSTSLVDVGVRFEYNFWPYGTGYEYRGARRFTPFITIGAGASFYGGPEKGATMNLPIGAGIKYKIGNRLNLTAEWAMRFTLSDKLDGSKDPLGIKSSGLFKNTDGYSVLQIALTYDLWEKCKTCNNDRY